MRSNIITRSLFQTHSYKTCHNLQYNVLYKQQYGVNSNRQFSTQQNNSLTAVPLAYDKIRYGVKSNNNDHVYSIIFAHCLLGNRHFWSRRFLQQLDLLLQRSNIKLDVYFIDIRNHGQSQHTTTHTYNDLSYDIYTFINKLKLHRPFLCGFSMGGKAVLANVLQYMTLQSCAGVISLDCSPAAYTHRHTRFFDAYKKIDLSSIHNIQQADKLLVKYLPRIDERQFLLTNLVKNDNNVYEWSCNWPVLEKYEAAIHGFDINNNNNNNTQSQWHGPSLFIGGINSPRLTLHEYKQTIPQYFPNATVELIESGHFVHQEQPYITAALIANFIDKNIPRR